MAKIDPVKFNTDPKHEQERSEFDALVEGSFNRLAEKKKKTAPPSPENRSFLDDLFDMFGKD